jgi:transcriptional regulator with XRE-family HTH domain
MTLQDLATNSGVSRAMISKVEREESSATATLLHKLCISLQVSLSDLLTPKVEYGSLVRKAQRLRWQDPATGFVREIVAPRAAGSKLEVVEVTLPPKALVSYPSNSDSYAPSSNYCQYIVAHTDGLRVRQSVDARDAVVDPSARTSDLAAGDALYMGRIEQVSFENLNDIPCKYWVVIEHFS